MPVPKTRQRYTCVMDVHEASESLGVTPRRIRALIQQGRLTAHKQGQAWNIDGLDLHRARRRPLSEHSRLILARALHNRSLVGLTGQDRKRTAARIGELRTSDDAAALLIDWWGGKPFGPLNFGTNLVDHALEGNSAYVAEALRQPRREYLRKPTDLADVVSSERAILGLTPQELAVRAEVRLADLRKIERGERLSTPAPARKILRALDIEPTALPDLAAA